ncbi:hypothetical protein SUVZ_03G0440 [Saccharomyces uvarum]|uniref:Uncharacterized protein n=1 Tax=Saccharomyces uvarum TaxID=230603 RepID=A0ABN8WTB1_SACUV|nr:hypothetical protein SUVZ_03G0440 [Saccharomyces uvarum]
MHSKLFTILCVTLFEVIPTVMGVSFIVPGTSITTRVVGCSTFDMTLRNNTLNLRQLEACLGNYTASNLALYSEPVDQFISAYENGDEIKDSDHWLDCLDEQDVSTEVWVAQCMTYSDEATIVARAANTDSMNWISEHLQVRYLNDFFEHDENQGVLYNLFNSKDYNL